MADVNTSGPVASILRHDAKYSREPSTTAMGSSFGFAPLLSSVAANTSANADTPWAMGTANTSVNVVPSVGTESLAGPLSPVAVAAAASGSIDVEADVAGARQRLDECLETAAALMAGLRRAQVPLTFRQERTVMALYKAAGLDRPDGGGGGGGVVNKGTARLRRYVFPPPHMAQLALPPESEEQAGALQLYTAEVMLGSEAAAERRAQREAEEAWRENRSDAPHAKYAELRAEPRSNHHQVYSHRRLILSEADNSSFYGPLNTSSHS